MVEFVQILTRALRNSTYGVASQLATLGTLNPPVPRITKIIDSVEDDEALEGTRKLDWPVLVVTMQTPAESEVEFGEVMRDYNVDLFVDIVCADKESALSFRDICYISRAVIKCIRDLLDDKQDVDQNMNNVQYLALNRITWGPVVQELPNGVIVGTVIPNFRIRDSKP